MAGPRLEAHGAAVKRADRGNNHDPAAMRRADDSKSNRKGVDDSVAIKQRTHLAGQQLEALWRRPTLDDLQGPLPMLPARSRAWRRHSRRRRRRGAARGRNGGSRPAAAPPRRGPGCRRRARRPRPATRWYRSGCDASCHRRQRRRSEPRSGTGPQRWAGKDLLRRVVAPRPAGLGRLDRLAVDHACRRAGLAAHGRACRHEQVMVDPAPRPVVAPAVEEPLHRGVGREVLRQQAPWQPVVSTYSMASTPRRRSVSRRRPSGLAAGDAARSTATPPRTGRLHTSARRADIGGG